MVKKVYTPFQLLRYPLVFGGVLLAYFTAFSYRKNYFKEDIEEVKLKNLEQSLKDNAALELARQRKKESQVYKQI